MKDCVLIFMDYPLQSYAHAVYPLFSLGMVSIVPLLKFGNFSNPFPNMLNTILIPSEAECGIFQACQIIFIFFSVPVMMIINSCIALTFLYNLYLRPRYENSVLSQYRLILHCLVPSDPRA